MTIIAVDNLIPRLTKLRALLDEIFPDDEIASFADPFYAVQYSANKGVDIAFVQEKLRPISPANVSRLMRKFNENAKVFLINDDLDASKENIETLITPPPHEYHFRDRSQSNHQEITPQIKGITT